MLPLYLTFLAYNKDVIASTKVSKFWLKSAVTLPMFQKYFDSSGNGNFVNTFPKLPYVKLVSLFFNMNNLFVGLPEYGVLPFDPFFAKEVVQKRGGPNFNYKLRLKNVYERGWTQSRVTKFR